MVQISKEIGNQIIDVISKRVPIELIRHGIEIINSTFYCSLLNL